MLIACCVRVLTRSLSMKHLTVACLKQQMEISDDVCIRAMPERQAAWALDCPKTGGAWWWRERRAAGR